MKMEDSRRKFHLLELNLIKLQWHGKIWEAANREYNRLFHIYRGTDWIKPGGQSEDKDGRRPSIKRTYARMVQPVDRNSGKGKQENCNGRI